MQIVMSVIFVKPIVDKGFDEGITDLADFGNLNQAGKYSGNIYCFCPIHQISQIFNAARAAFLPESEREELLAWFRQELVAYHL